MAFGNYYGDIILAFLLTGVDPATVNGQRLGLWQEDPGSNYEPGPGEIAGSTYERAEIGILEWEARAGGGYQNSVVIAFAEAEEDWGTVTHVALMDVTGWTICHGPLIEEQEIVLGTTIKFAIGALAIIMV